MFQNVSVQEQLLVRVRTRTREMEGEISIETLCFQFLLKVHISI